MLEGGYKYIFRDLHAYHSVPFVFACVYYMLLVTCVCIVSVDRRVFCSPRPLIAVDARFFLTTTTVVVPFPSRKQLEPQEFVELTRAVFGDSAELPQGTKAWRGMRGSGVGGGGGAAGGGASVRGQGGEGGPGGYGGMV